MKTTTFYPLKYYEGRYEISRSGIVRSCNSFKFDTLGRINDLKQKVIKINLDKRSGYPVVKLTTNNGKYGTQYLHRLLALTFLRRPDNKNIVNHKDGEKQNYSLTNLEWTTQSENHLHAIALNLIKLPFENKIPVKDRCTGRKYPSIKRSTVTLNLDYFRTKRMLKGIIPNTTCLEIILGLTN